MHAALAELCRKRRKISRRGERRSDVKETGGWPGVTKHSRFRTRGGCRCVEVQPDLRPPLSLMNKTSWDTDQMNSAAIESSSLLAIHTASSMNNFHTRNICSIFVHSFLAPHLAHCRSLYPKPTARIAQTCRTSPTLRRNWIAYLSVKHGVLWT